MFIITITLVGRMVPALASSWIGGRAQGIALTGVRPPSVISVISDAGEDTATGLKRLETVLAEGADLHERGAIRGENAVSAAVYGRRFYFIPRLLALGVSPEEPDKFAITAWSLLVAWTGLVPPEKGTMDWTSAQATVGLAVDLQRHRRGDMVTSVRDFTGTIVGYIESWDQISQMQIRQKICKMNLAAGFAYEEQWPQPFPYSETWLCAREDEAGKASATFRADKLLRNHLHNATGSRPRAGFREISYGPKSTGLVARAVRSSLANPNLRSQIAALTRLETCPHPYTDTFTGRVVMGYDVRATSQLAPRAEHAIWLSQVLADGTVMPWFVERATATAPSTPPSKN